MKKQIIEKQLTRDEMNDRFNDYFNKSLNLAVVGAILLGLSVFPILPFLIGIIGSNWGTMGLVIATAGISCFVIAEVFSHRASYWAKKSREYLSKPTK